MLRSWELYFDASFCLIRWMAWPKRGRGVCKGDYIRKQKIHNYNKEPGTREKDNELHDVLHSSLIDDFVCRKWQRHAIAFLENHHSANARYIRLFDCECTNLASHYTVQSLRKDVSARRETIRDHHRLDELR